MMRRREFMAGTAALLLSKSAHAQMARRLLTLSKSTPAPFVATTFIEDHFANNGGADVSLVGWVPDTIGNVAWSKNTASATDNALVSHTTKNVIGNNASRSHYQVKQTLPSANYKITWSHSDVAATFTNVGANIYIDTALDGYRVTHDAQSVPAMPALKFTQTNSGTDVLLATQYSGVWGDGVAHSISWSRWVMSDRVRSKITDNTLGFTWVCDDLSANKKTAVLYPGLSMRQTATIDDFVVQSIPPQNPGGSLLTSDGAWYWQGGIRGLVSGIYTYATWTTSAGAVQVARYHSGTIEISTLNAGLGEQDDHDNGNMIILPGGRLMCIYSRHSNTDNFLRYRITTNPLGSITTWDSTIWNTEQQIATTVPCSYAKPFILSDGNIRIYFRSGGTAQRDQVVATANAAAVESGSPSWGLTTIFTNSGQRPYVLCCQNGVNRIDFLLTDGHPDETSSSMFHCSMSVVGGVDTYVKSDGTSTGTLPITTNSTNLTLVHGTSGGTNWNWDIQIGLDGKPRALISVYPTDPFLNQGTLLTDAQYWHYRWTGSTWTGFALATAQHSVGALNNGAVQPSGSSANSYVGGMCFDGNDRTAVFLSLWDATDVVDKLSKWQINEGAQTVSKIKNIATDPSSHQWRPFSPAGYNSDLAVIWMEGGWVNYNVWQTYLRYS